jgi:bifunctional non-homologous end joining protein LigD
VPSRPKSGARRKLAEYRRKRDFSRTAEPSGDTDSAAREARAGQLRFVIQKHAASHLHFDFRLELDGVMKSWAVPKGPSLDPSVKRLAMEVEDHPIEYNTFEGTIPQGEYGGGTVMLWDRGTYTADAPGDPVEALRRGYERGDMKFILDGERLHGSWVLVRTRRGADRGKPQWLLIKHRDEFAEPGSDIVADVTTSVATGRTMEEIASGKSKVWRSNRGTRDSGLGTRPRSRSRRSPEPSSESRVPSPGVVEPMYASIGTAVPEDDGWTFEPKYDGIRMLAFATPTAVQLITRNGKDKTAQFPEIAAAVLALAKRSRRSLLLDGEVVAVERGAPARFQELQQRMHVKDEDAIAGFAERAPAAYMVFDLLMDGDEPLLDQPWSERRKRLELRLRNRTSPELRLGASAPGDGREMLARARADGWEGIIAKRTDSPYQPGHRSKQWLKLKVEYRQEFVVGGYTEPRNTREYIGALLLGYFDNGRFIYVGHTGGGFDRAGLEEMYRRLKPLARKTSPFEETPKTNEPAHWVKPEVVVEVKFSEWTADGKLRQPIFLGVRDDKSARDVHKERESVQQWAQEIS